MKTTAPHCGYESDDSRQTGASFCRLGLARADRSAVTSALSSQYGLTTSVDSFCPSVPRLPLKHLRFKFILRCIELLTGVWCGKFNISLPEKIEALSGSCVLIECAFEIEERFHQNLTESAAGIWFKDNSKNPVFNSRNPSEKHFRGKLTGKIEEKNCTTIFYDVSSNHDGKYYFRIEGNGGLKYTYHKPDVTINVIDSPHNPTVKLYVDEKEVQSQQEVLEGSSVCLSCSAETLCSSPPATLTWSSTSRHPFSLQEKQNQNKLISHLNFTATPLQHTVTFTCTVTYQLQDNNKTAHSNLTLHVTYAPKISLSSSCNRTDVTVCLCEVDGNPSPKLEWHLSGRPVTNSTIMSISEERLSSTVLRSFITLHHSLTHTSTVQCVTTNTHGNDKQLFQWLLYAQESTECQQASVPLLILLTLILLLYALTVGLGLYKIRQLSTKIKAQNEAGTYASLQLSAPSSDYETLNVNKVDK
ncbi:sialic acid-binding Ig-like lectin 14 [Xyrauchen texanus]|uniref:sialic acid-binding Ig-like lectin 14 n=1 Tax=Xyrauchen texanus TaxID=154827 RepID=UPI0022429448|nr:sialic acid-binding Ig-like lectin 14 [Xyrauchen texanus]